MDTISFKNRRYSTVRYNVCHLYYMWRRSLSWFTKKSRRKTRPPDKPPDSVPSRFVRQGSDEWQRLKAEAGREPLIVTMHHGDAGAWVRSA